MHNILLINSSLNGDQGNSNILANDLLTQIRIKEDVAVTYRDLDKNQITHLSKQEMLSWMTPKEERNDEQHQLANISDELIAEVEHSHTIIVGLPMYNFGIPSTLKTWIDRIARSGITFKYTEQGPVGLLQNKRLIVVAARGGQYKGTSKDSQSQYIRDVFSFIGITKIDFIYAEELATRNKEDNLAKAKKDIKLLVNSF